MLQRKTGNFVLVCFLLLAPTLASAQDRYDPWSRDNQDYARDRRNNDWGRKNRRRDYDRRDLRQSVERIDRLSGQLKSDLGDALDRSRINGRDVEDRINQLTHDFHEAAAKFKDRFDDGRNYDRAAPEAQRVLELGSELDRFVSRQGLNSKVVRKWDQISSDLGRVADAYGYGFNSYGDDRDYRRRGNDDEYRRRQY